MGTFNVQTKQLTNVNLDSAEELKRFVAGGIQNARRPYQGGTPPNFQDAANDPSPTPVKPVVVTPSIPVITSTTTYEIVSEDSKKAVLKVTNNGTKYTLKIESLHGASSGLNQLGHIMARGGNQASHTGFLGDPVTLQIDNRLAEYYAHDGTPKDRGATPSSMVISMWNKAVLPKMADDLTAWVRSHASQEVTPEYTSVLYALGGVPVPPSQ